MQAGRFQQRPRQAHRWWLWLVASQLLVALAWWQWEWRIGLPLMLASHLVFWWGVLWPYSPMYGPVLCRLSTREPVVWLTIDDGPSDDTLAMLDLLDAAGARATFFLVAQRAAQRPQLVHEIVRRGHEVGNHSLSHAHAWFWAHGPWRMRREIVQAQRILGQLAGRPPRWFRAVAGMSNPFVHPPLRELGLARVAWSARGFDGVRCNPDRALVRLARGLGPGAIVLLHEGGACGRHRRILRGLLEELHRRGLRAELPPAASDV